MFIMHEINSSNMIVVNLSRIKGAGTKKDQSKRKKTVDLPEEYREELRFLFSTNYESNLM